MAKRKPVPKPTRYEIETFRSIGPWEIDRLKQDAPDCFNGFVSVRKWRIVAELIEEPVEVIAERLRKLWRESDNHHDWHPLRNAAEQIGIELSHDELGRDRKKKGQP